MAEVRHCKGYLVTCKNPAVKGRLFCFTCAGRKSRNKKNLALETSERDVKELRRQLEELAPELEHWKALAQALTMSEAQMKKELQLYKKSLFLQGHLLTGTGHEDNIPNPNEDTESPESNPNQLDLSGAASALLSIGSIGGNPKKRPRTAAAARQAASVAVTWTAPHDHDLNYAWGVAPAAEL